MSALSARLGSARLGSARLGSGFGNIFDASVSFIDEHMRRLVLIGFMLACCQCGAGAAGPLVPVRPSQEPVGISATAVDGFDRDGNLIVLVTVTNQSRELLVLGGGGADDDWYTSWDVDTGDAGIGGGGHGISDGPVPGRISCPQPSYDLILAPGSSVGRLQRLPLGVALGEHVSKIQIDVRLFLVSRSLRCGPLELLEREVNVAFDEASLGRAP